MWTLSIILLVTTLAHPKPHQGSKITMFYDTQYTCQIAERDVDAAAIIVAAEAIGTIVQSVKVSCGTFGGPLI